MSILDDRKFEKEIERFLGITGKRYWEETSASIKTTRGNFYLREIVLKRNPLITPIRQYLLLYKAGRAVWRNRTPDIDFLATTAWQINRILKQVNTQGEKQIKGRLMSDDIRSLLFEARMAAHFLRNGFDINFVEYNATTHSNPTFDFLVSKSAIEAEVECKWKSIDAGRKIKQTAFALLCDELYERLGLWDGLYLAKVRCSQPLGKSQQTHELIANAIQKAISDSLSDVSVSTDIEITIQKLVSHRKVNSPKGIEIAIEPFRTSGSHLAILYSSQSQLILNIECEKRDTILDAIYDELKKSISQFSGTRPGLLSCYLEGILPEEWYELEGDNGLARITAHLFKKAAANHIHTLSYISEAVKKVEPGQIESTYPSLVFKNPNSKYNWGENIFGIEFQPKFLR